jgi:purine-binding chemotaxis protein CheW
MMIDGASIFHDLVSLRSELTTLRYDMIARKDEITYVMKTHDPSLIPLKKVWIETIQLATKAAEIFEKPSNLESRMQTLESLISGLRSAMERTRTLSKGAGRALERSHIVIFELADSDYCFQVDSVQEVVPRKRVVVLPKMPFFMKGVMEHRGAVVPVIDPAEILNVESRRDNRRLMLVRKNGESVALYVDKVKEVTPVLTGYFKEPRGKEPFLKQVYEDGTRRISMLDPRLMLEAGLEKALEYSRRVNGLRTGSPNMAASLIQH